MANISITSACNRNCEYCFARTGRRPAVSQMSLANFQSALDFLERSGIDQARLLGGEPTLHPEFTRFAAMALERGLRLLVFSNGLIPEAALRWLESSPPERVSVLLNTAIGDKVQERTLSRLGTRAMLGFNIHTPALDADPLLNLIARYGLTPAIRFGLAHPAADGSNAWLHPRHYRTVGKQLLEFSERASQAGVRISFDCGFVPCMFPEGGLEALGPAAEEVGPRCSPILDLLPDGHAVSCYPLASLAREPLDNSATAADLRRRFQERFAARRRAGVFPECSECAWRRDGRCAGGCLAASAQRLRSSAGRVTAPKIEPKRRWAIPYVDQPPVFWERLEAEFGPYIREVYFPLPGGIVGSGRPPQPEQHLEAFLRRPTLPRAVLVNPVILPRPVDEIAPAIVEALKRLAGEFGITSATVSNLQLAERIRERIPGLPLTASVLMDIAQPNQALLLKGICDALVPASRVMRDLPALRALRAAFSGTIRLIVNESCLPGCPYRTQHFYEMGAGLARPESLCNELLKREPWLRLTSGWVLPQHLHHLEDVVDEWKLAGRVTLRDPVKYRQVLSAYVHRRPLAPHEIGGGPASVLEPIAVGDEFYERTLHCRRRCDECSACRDLVLGVM